MASYRVHYSVDLKGLTAQEIQQAFGNLASSAYGFRIEDDSCYFYVDAYDVDDDEEGIEEATLIVDEHLTAAASQTGLEPPAVRVISIEEI